MENTKKGDRRQSFFLKHFKSQNIFSKQRRRAMPGENASQGPGTAWF
jgi:hypothetical protein